MTPSTCYVISGRGLSNSPDCSVKLASYLTPARKAPQFTVGTAFRGGMTNFDSCVYKYMIGFRAALQSAAELSAVLW